ncbi:hypothetical protein NUKP86_44640 [Klebsiella variicola]|nr:hypothetical protein NUKP86_44640 [Klebsiella variicola]
MKSRHTTDDKTRKKETTPTIRGLLQVGMISTGTINDMDIIYNDASIARIKYLELSLLPSLYLDMM